MLYPAVDYSPADPPLGIEVADEWLVNAARSKASGANVHHVNHLCQLFLYYQRLRLTNEPTYGPRAEELRHQLRALAHITQ